MMLYPYSIRICCGPWGIHHACNAVAHLPLRHLGFLVLAVSAMWDNICSVL